MAKRILCTIDTCGVGGAETVFVQLLNGLDRTVYSPYVVLKGKGWLYDEVVKLGIHPEIVSMEGTFNVSYLVNILRIIRQNKIDLIHSHLFGSNLYCSIGGMLVGVPVISTFHGAVDADLNGRLVATKFRLINGGSRYIVFVSNYLKDYYSARTVVSRKKCVTIHNGIDCDRYIRSKDRRVRDEWGYCDDDFVIGAIGNVRPAKGYQVLLRAAVIVAKRYRNCKFIIAGEGHGDLYSSLLELRKNLGLEEIVKLIGFRSDVNKVLNGLDLFVLPSTTEGFSISTIEAMSASLPVVVTDSGGPAEIVGNGKSGLVVLPNSPEKLAEAIETCIADNDLRQRLGEVAAQEVRSRYSINAMTNSYRTLYDHVTDND